LQAALLQISDRSDQVKLQEGISALSSAFQAVSAQSQNRTLESQDVDSNVVDTKVLLDKLLDIQHQETKSLNSKMETVLAQSKHIFRWR
jgi:hypothetical protein